MARSFLIFDFGLDEEAAQQARHRIEGWKQAFRLDKRLQVKFERVEPDAKQDAASKTSSSKPVAKSGNSGNPDEQSGSNGAPQSEIRLIVRLDFSDHEKLTHKRWLERIPAEEPFRGAKPRIVLSSDREFAAAEHRFDSLDHSARSERSDLKV